MNVWEIYPTREEIQERRIVHTIFLEILRRFFPGQRIKIKEGITFKPHSVSGHSLGASA